ncbi:MAG: hypothetical protein ACRD3W_19345, partial [Terriglobales bacterium]
LESSIKGHAVIPSAITRLPSLEKVHGSERLVMGAASARRLFPAPHIATLSFGNGAYAAVADYQVQLPYRERLKLMCVRYSDPGTAAQAYSNYLNSFEGMKNLSQYGTSLFKVGSSYFFCQQTGPQVILITGAHKKVSPQMLARLIN